MKPLRIAITGGRGRLAPLVADRLRSGHSEVICFSRSAGDNFRPITLLFEPSTLANFDAILHMGWSTVPLTSEERPGIEQTTDLPLLQEMLDACAAVRCPPHFVFFSTAAVYGNTTVPATEETSCSPLGHYARGKLMAERIIQGGPLACSILRVSNVFGSAHSPARPQGLISRICQAIHDDTAMSIWGDGGNTKDYLFLTDFLEAVQAVVTRRLTGTFNVASEQSVSVNNIISLVESITGKRLKLAHCPPFSWDVLESHISTRKLRSATGWRARHDLAEAIRELTEAELRCV
jgi:UDP-glucose 4-epimerase